jgi:ornithine cyclodeaminase
LAREPIVRGAWLKPGQLITAVGADDPTKCELDADALLRARLIVDSRETAGANGDVYRAVQMGHSLDDLIAAEIGDVIAGKAKGRQSSEDIVIAKLVGIGALDVAAANVALARLRERR